MRTFIVVAIAVMGASCDLWAIAAEKPLDFARHVQPILAAKCMKCHGPSKTSGGIAFDSHDRAFAKTESGEIAITPGKPEASELITRITSTDETTRMPPEGKPLTPAEIEAIRTWIKQGAQWSQPWAYRKLERPTVPVVKNSTWGRNEIDAFILSELQTAKLQPATRADKRALVRRAYYNLLGLPPTPAQVDAFVNDTAANAWEKLIDQLLSSEHYGEHWGRKWLDVVRFAETNSFERDGTKPHAWRYRDYVIRSLNTDKPYDQFLKEQLAGDEMNPPTNDGLIASGFYRLGVWDDEPADRELAQYDGYDDIVSTIGQGMLGLTFNCARCHNHKIDPIPQADYYKLVAFVRNLIPMASNGPNIEEQIFTSAEERQQFEEERKRQQAAANAVQAELTSLEQKFLANEEDDPNQARDLADLEYKYYRDSWQKLPDFDNLKAETEGQVESGKFDVTLTSRDSAYGFVFTGKLKVSQSGKYTFFLNSDDGARLSLNGVEIILHDGIHGVEPQKTAEVELSAGLVPIRLDYFQNQHGRGLRVAWKGPEFKRRLLSKDHDTTANNKERGNLVNRIREEGSKVLGVAETKRYLEGVKKLEELKKDPPAEKALVARDRGPNVAETFVLVRGIPGNHGEQVSPGFPVIFETPAPNFSQPEADSKSSGRRTRLAEWIASPENRLTARVITNRIWQGHFGRGIVRSSNNFGGMGTPPTHPELLDWLASELVSGGWKMKRLHKLIMMSEAYQMSSQGSPEAMTKDPANDLFWRYDMRRLSAEEVRDSVLAVNGSLNPKMYGPSIYPTIQAEVLAGQSVPGKGWGKSSPEEQARRSVYIHVKRSLITPLLASFDFAETDSSCEARFTTTQPGQSFALLNGDFANQQAAIFAQRLAREAGSDFSSQVKQAYRLTVGREPREIEITRARTLVTKLEQEYKLSHELALDQFALYMLNLNEFMYLE